jgi:hypothetical protein
MPTIELEPDITGDQTEDTAEDNGANNGGNGSAAALEPGRDRGAVAHGEELDQFLGQFGAGYQAQLHRAAPLWAARCSCAW